MPGFQQKLQSTLKDTNKQKRSEEMKHASQPDLDATDSGIIKEGI